VDIDIDDTDSAALACESLCRGVVGVERVRMVERGRRGSRVSGIPMGMMGVWALGGGRCVGCNFALLLGGHALDPLAFGESTSHCSSLLPDETDS
jgi:hypothetical protein